MSLRKTADRFVLMLLLLVSGAGELRSQAPDEWDTLGPQRTREELQTLRAELEKAARSPAFSSEFRERAEAEAEAVRHRLEAGDFQVGDQVVLDVQGEETLSGDFTVRPGPSLSLPMIGEISLAGVLRSELEAHLTREVGRFLRNPVVRARSLLRVTLSGAVGRPGFYLVPAEAVLTDVLMKAGGPTSQAQLDQLRVHRNGKLVWDGAALQKAITEGQTLDQLGLRSGDEIVLSAKGQQQRWLALVSGVSGFVWMLTRIVGLF